MTPAERELARNVLLVKRHARYVAHEEYVGYTRIVLRTVDGGGTESVGPLPISMAWAAAATSLSARAAEAPPPRRVLELDVDDLLDFEGEPWPWEDEEARRSAS